MNHTFEPTDGFEHECRICCEKEAAHHLGQTLQLVTPNRTEEDEEMLWGEKK